MHPVKNLLICFGLGLIFSFSLYSNEPIEVILQVSALFGLGLFFVLKGLTRAIWRKPTQKETAEKHPKSAKFPNFCHPGDLCTISLSEEKDTLHITKHSHFEPNLEDDMPNSQGLIESGTYRRQGNKWEKADPTAYQVVPKPDNENAASVPG